MAYVAPSSAVIISSHVRAGGTLVELSKNQFLDLIRRFGEKDFLVIHGMIGVLKKKHLYLTAINGITFICETAEELPVRVDIEAKRLHILKY